MIDRIETYDEEAHVGEKILSKAVQDRIVDDIRGFCSSEGSLSVTIQSWWSGSQRWARNQASLTGDQRDVRIAIQSELNGVWASCATNQFDTKSLQSACKFVKSELMDKKPGSSSYDMISQPLRWDTNGSVVWSDKTFNRTYIENGKAVAFLTSNSKERGLLAAGYIETAAARALKYRRDNWNRESRWDGEVTQAQCSVTVRHPLGTGSGWAGKTSFEINRLDLTEISQLAFDKCIKSIDPVRIEPGRYQAILEPDAGAVLFGILVHSLQRVMPEKDKMGPYYLGTDGSIPRHLSKLGLSIVDKRITISHDPSDPLAGTHPQPGIGPVTLIENGVLTSMYMPLREWRNGHADHYAPLGRTSFKVEGTDISQDQMIETVKRGILVSRLSQPEAVDSNSMLYTGVTRDGLWLIEDGRITKAIRNFRWTESPLFALNNVEEIGQSVAVFKPASIRVALMMSFADSLNNIVVPSLKVNDFSFTSTIDAV